MTIFELKRRMRADALETRQVAARAAHGAGESLAEIFFFGFQNFLAGAQPQVVAGYWPMRGEIDIRPLLHHLSRQGIPCALPVVVEKDQPLVFRLWHPGSELVMGRFGTSEPSADATETVPALTLIPLLAFDQAGGRLGYGGGYYDRSLAGLRQNGSVQAVGVAFDAQEVDDAPMAESDERLDWVITESRIIQCSG